MALNGGIRPKSRSTVRASRRLIILLRRNYKTRFLRWRSNRARVSDPGPARVHAVEWLLAAASVVIAVLCYETRNYALLASAAQVLACLSFILVMMSTREVFRTGMIG